MEERVACGEKIGGYLFEVVTQHVDRPKDDIVDMLLNVDVEGEKLSLEEVHAICYLLFLASIDTVATMLSFIIRHLARDAALFNSLKDRSKIADSVDEFLHTLYQSESVCEQDTEFHGVRASDNIVIPSFVTDRDERTFADPDTFNPDRTKKERNQHHAFGAGAHKCIGLHVAKMEVRVDGGQHERVASLELISEEVVTGTAATMGLDTLPIKVTLRAKLVFRLLWV